MSSFGRALGSHRPAPTTMAAASRNSNNSSSTPPSITRRPSCPKTHHRPSTLADCYAPFPRPLPKTTRTTMLSRLPPSSILKWNRSLASLWRFSHWTTGKLHRKVYAFVSSIISIVNLLPADPPTVLSRVHRPEWTITSPRAIGTPSSPFFSPPIPARAAEVTLNGWGNLWKWGSNLSHFLTSSHSHCVTSTLSVHSSYKWKPPETFYLTETSINHADITIKQYRRELY